jgi:flagellar biogenesis protein FliO
MFFVVRGGNLESLNRYKLRLFTENIESVKGSEKNITHPSAVKPMSAEVGWVGTARGVLAILMFFAVAALVLQIFFGQLGQVAAQYPVPVTNPFYDAYNKTATALKTAMGTLAPVFGVLVAIIVIGIIWGLVRILG